MKAIQYLFLLFALPTVAVAQTFEHDSGVFNQFLLTGADPATGYTAETNDMYTTYMQTFHSGYFKTAPAFFSKILNRTEVKLNVMKEKEYADSIAKDLLRRAEKEGLTMLDRKKIGGSVSSYIEVPRIQEALDKMQQKVTDLSLAAGGSHSDIVRNWRYIYDELQMSFNVVDGASYLPSAERKKEYLNILNDIESRTKQLDGVALQLQVEKELKEERKAKAYTQHRLAEVATLCMIRWRDNARAHQVGTIHEGGGIVLPGVKTNNK